MKSKYTNSTASMIFRVNFINQLPGLIFLGLQVISFCCMAWYVNFDKAALVIFSSGILMILLPVCYLHVEYYLQNNGQEIELSAQGVSLREKNGVVNFFRKDEIREIIICKSASMDKGGDSFEAIVK